MALWRGARQSSEQQPLKSPHHMNGDTDLHFDVNNRLFFYEKTNIRDSILLYAAHNHKTKKGLARKMRTRRRY